MLDEKPNTATAKPKTEAQIKKDQERAEKLAKYEEKMKKLKEQEVAKGQKEKKSRDKAKTIIEYTKNTKPGERKGTFRILFHSQPFFQTRPSSFHLNIVRNTSRLPGMNGGRSKDSSSQSMVEI